MLPHHVETNRRHDVMHDSEWDRFQAQGLLGMLQVEHYPLTDPDVFKIAQDAFTQTVDLYANEKHRKNSSTMIRAELTAFLTTRREGTHFALNMLDRHLSALAKLAAQISDPDIFPRVLTEVLGEATSTRYDALASSALKIDVTTQDLDMNYRELGMMSVVFRNIVSYGMWKSIEVSKISQKVARAEGRDRANVGAVALDHFGEVLEIGYRGQDRTNRSRHAEENLLRNLAMRGLTNRVAVIVVNLEPCAKRSDKHLDLLGHQKGCSTLLLEAGIPIVGYVLGDENIKDRGRGAKLLRDSNEVMVYRADVPEAISVASTIQTLSHLKQVATILDFFDNVS